MEEENISQDDSAVEKTDLSLNDEIQKRKKRAKIFLMVNLVIFVVSLLVLVFVFFYLFNQDKQDAGLIIGDAKKSEIEEGEKLVKRKIDGVLVPEGEDANYLIAVMIDNHWDARPPAGLSKAHLVFEAEVEGGITRIMGVFSTGQEIEKIGPVRSARPYFIDWARELSALYTHVGGSPDALVKLQMDKIESINEFYNGQYFWRDDNRDMPHNVFTSTELLEEYMADSSVDSNRFIPWEFKDEASEEERPDSGSINISYRLETHKVEWKYDKIDNSYIRYVAEDPYMDASGEIITAKNVLIQIAEAEEVDEELRLEMENIGSGKALVCMDGTCKTASWKKEHTSDRTRFYTEEGKEFKFNPGMTWVEVVRPEIEYSFN